MNEMSAESAFNCVPANCRASGWAALVAVESIATALVTLAVTSIRRIAISLLLVMSLTDGLIRLATPF